MRRFHELIGDISLGRLRSHESALELSQEALHLSAVTIYLSIY